MSRSKKRNPVSTIACCKSQKKDKRICNRIFRCRVKHCLRTDKELPYRLREIMDVWNFVGDGKCFWGFDWNGIEKLMRK